MGIGIVASFSIREVFVSTMATVYNLGQNADTEKITPSLEETLRQQKHENGTLVYTPLTAVTLMVFYVFALQCVSTVAIVRRETNFLEMAGLPMAVHGHFGVGAGLHHLARGALAGLSITVCSAVRCDITGLDSLPIAEGDQKACKASK